MRNPLTVAKCLRFSAIVFGLALYWCHATYTTRHSGNITVQNMRATCRDRLDAGGFRRVEETILLLTWHEVQDTELHMAMHIIGHIKSITKYDIILCRS